MQEKEKVGKERVGIQKLAEEMSKEYPINQRGAKIFIEKLFKKIENYIQEGKAVKLGNIGILKKVLKEKRRARNPRTGEEIVIPEHFTVKLKVSKMFKEKLNKLE